LASLGAAGAFVCGGGAFSACGGGGSFSACADAALSTCGALSACETSAFGVFSACGVVGFAAAEADMSSPFAASTAIGVLTGTPSVPSSTRICASLPSSTASTSIVALSVSISAITSPAWISSPTCLTQRASLPSVMVGDSAGIRICVVIAQPPTRMSV
jgi:hypothetical protein